MRWGEVFGAGERRTVTWFAWFPAQMSDGTWVWLEYYFERQLYVVNPARRYWLSERTYVL
jgi:hypothetical protein